MGRGIKLGLALLLLLAALGAVAGGAVWWIGQPAGIAYTVERGDTLFLIARSHGVSVDELRGWNGIEGDLIEVGQVLRIHPKEAPEPEPVGSARRPRPGPAPGGTADARPPLVMPAEQPCLDGPSLSGEDREMAASAGLDRDQVSAAMGGFVSHVLPCIHEAGAQPTKALLLEITVACTGRVSGVRVVSSGDWPSDVAGCVTEVLGYTPFPAHGLPDGDVFQYPLRFSAD